MNSNFRKTLETVSRKERFLQWLPMTLILLLAAGLYFYELGTESLWVDELLSIDDAKNLEFNKLIRGKNSRPIYYIILRFWMQFGSSEAWLRGLCLLFSLGSIFLLYRLASRLLGTPTATIAALIAALSPLFIHHAQEVRMYAPSTFFTLAGTLLMTLVLETPTPKLMGFWAGARLLGILTTPLNLLMLFPDTVLFGWKFRRERRVLLGFVACLGAIALLWLPVAIPLATSSAPQFMGGVHIPTVVDKPDIVSAKPGIFDVMFQLARFTVWPFGRPISEKIYWFYKFYAFMLAALLAVGLLSQRENQERSGKMFVAKTLVMFVTL
jgi:mannosyltransferase